jgi:LysM repeat protein
VRGQAEGGTPLRFTVVKLLDPEGQEVVVEDEIDGLVSVSAGGPASEPTEAPPVATPPVVSGVEPTPVPPTPSSSAVYHTVQAGENLYRIALRYGTTVNAIVAANNLPNRNSVRVGQVLLIPVGASAGTVTYVVQPGDTLHSIARRFGTTVDALAAHNGIAPPYTIKVGQTLVIVP